MGAGRYVGAALPVGAVLAGGLGRRIGGRKAVVEVEGRPLISYPLAALRAVLDEVAVVAKADTVLPPLPDDVGIWVEDEEPRHPVAGILTALRRARGRAVLVCAGDMPLLTPRLVRALARGETGGAPAIVVRTGDGLEPLLGRYEAAALPALEARFDGGASARALVAALEPAPLDVADPADLLNVNAPEDVLAASVALRERTRGGPART